ncbi:MAG: beta-N-acetylhexosaminidase [Clostridia bacterium]|nr:beta-N-acetylhexosaminidase [Clostridia bacterium]
MSDFRTVGLMIDLSRNAVMSLDGWRRFLPIVSKMGYNAMFLYMEDTYEVEGEPYFGYMRGRYSIDEMKALDALGAEYGIEMIPCIQTLGHLSTLSKWAAYPNDTEDILLVGDERIYTLIDNMFRTLSGCFKTRRIHIGMDEADRLGKGKYLALHGYENQGDIMRKHLTRVAEIAEKYGYEPMMWSDMFFRGWNNSSYYAEAGSIIPDEYRNALPATVTPVYWDYYMNTEKRYDDMLDIHRQLSDKTAFAGGVWTWLGFTPDNLHSIQTMLPAIRMCRKHGTKDVFFTLWGDDGAECSRFAVLAALYHIAEYIKGNEDEDKIKAGFEAEFGVSYDDFLLLDKPNYVGRFDSPWATNPSKYAIFSDCFQGFLDYVIAEGGNGEYADCAQRLYTAEQKAGDYSYLFKTQRLLCEILSHKYELGVKTRAAYKAGDKEELRHLVDEDYTAVINLLPDFYDAFRTQWELENKTCGFEVQDLRLGGLLMRMKNQKRMLEEYLDGKRTSIPELECEILQYRTREAGRSMYYNMHYRAISSNVVRSN